MNKLVKIIFNPMSKVVEVEKGTVLLDAIRKAGIRISCICGGEGECGTCRVILEKGEVRDISFKYERLLSAEEIAEGYRLACQIRVESDCEFTIPVESRIHSPKILISTKIGIEKIDPAARKHLVTSVPAETEEKRSIELQGYSGSPPKLSGEMYEKLFSLKLPVTATLSMAKAPPEIISLELEDKTRENYGLAIDVGTTISLR